VPVIPWAAPLRSGPARPHDGLHERGPPEHDSSEVLNKAALLSAFNAYAHASRRSLEAPCPSRLSFEEGSPRWLR